MRTGDIKVVFEVGKEGDGLESFAEALGRGVSLCNKKQVTRVPFRQRECR